MLYLSTRNTLDAYTAYRAMHEQFAPDGGYYVPFRLPSFSNEDLAEFKQKTPSETIAYILNLFFGLRLSAWDVECAVGRNPFHITTVNQRLIIAEMWRNPQGNWEYLLENVYSLMLGKSTQPVGWSRIAIGIALLFSLYSSCEDCFSEEGLDVAVTSLDFSDIIAILYAKDMGLPFRVVICSFNENGAVWDFFNKGILSTGLSVTKNDFPEPDVTIPQYLEYFIYRSLGGAEVLRYLDACKNKTYYYISDEQLMQINFELFSAVVSSNRVDYLQSIFRKSNQYAIDVHAAHAYGGLQDYRARTGISKETVIFAKKRPNHIKE